MSIGNEIASTSPLIEWGVAAQSLNGGAESGDQYLIRPFPNGVLVAVVDGLGHGPKAATVAKTVVTTLEGHAHESVVPLLKRCHEELMGTRGVVMSLASFSALGETMTWLGVGNVRGLLLRADAESSPARESLLLRGGVVGYRLPTLRPTAIPVVRGDTLILATDGIRSGFAEGLRIKPVEGLTGGDLPQQIADRILARYGRGTDDALVLVTRYRGPVPSPVEGTGEGCATNNICMS